MRAVFDTNVLVSASFWRGAPFECLSAWLNGRCEAAVSPELLAEYHETVEELQREYPDHLFVAWKDALTETAMLVFPVVRASGATKDPGDEKVLECAVASEADFIVTGDKKHLLPLGSYQGIRILSPAEFLRQVA